MADRFPLIVDADNTNIKELPSGDNLDLTGSDIVNVVDVTTSGNMVVGGNLTVNGTTTTINSATLTIDDKNIVLASGAADAAAANGAGITIDGASANLLYSSSTDGFSFNKGVTVPSLTTTGNISFGDNDKAVFGAGSDLQIYHDGSTSFIRDSGTGDLQIRASNLLLTDVDGTIMLDGRDNGKVSIHHNGAEKLTTTSTGIDVTGTLVSDGLTVDGAASIGASTAKTNFYSDSTYNGIYNGSSLTSDESIYMGADILFFYAAGAERLRANSSGIDVTGTVLSDGLRFGTATDHTIKWGSGAEILGVGSADQSVHIRLDPSDASNFGYFQVTDGSSDKKLLLVDDSGDISFYESTGTTPKLFWDSSAERLGVGATSLTHTLHVTGSSNEMGLFKRSAAGNSEVKIDTTTSGDAKLTFANDGTAAFTMGRDNSDSSFRIASGGTLGSNDRLVINPSGNVGIATSSPSNALSVNGNMDITGTIALENSTGYGLRDNRNNLFLTTSADTAASNRTLTFGNATYGQTILDGGNVGIGTSPAQKLHVSSSSAIVGLLESTGSSAARLYFDNTGMSTAGDAQIWSQNNDLILNASGAERLRLASSEAVINEPSNDYDFRVESNSNTHALFVDAANSRTMINTLSTINAGALNVAGSIAFEGRTVNTYNHSSGWIDFIDTTNVLRFHSGAGGTDSSSMEISTNIAGQQSDAITIQSGGQIVINQDSKDRDFRVESDSNSNMLFVDAGQNRVGVGTSTANAALAVMSTDSSNPTMRVYGDNTNGTDASVRFQALNNSGTNRYADIVFDADIDTTGGIKILTDYPYSGDENIRFSNSGTVINEGGGSGQDFRVESNSNSHMLFVDAGNDRIGVNTSSPSDAMVHVANDIDSASYRDVNSIIYNLNGSITEAQAREMFRITADSVRRSCQVRITFQAWSGGGISNMSGGSMTCSIWKADGDVSVRVEEIHNGSESSGSVSMMLPTVSGDIVTFGMRAGNNGTASTYTVNTRIELVSNTPSDFTVADYSAANATATGSHYNGGFLLAALDGSDELSFNKAGNRTLVVNEDSFDRDFRVESNGNANMLFVDGGNDRVAVGSTGVTGSQFTVAAGTDATIVLDGDSYSTWVQDAQWNSLLLGGAYYDSGAKFAVTNRGASQLNIGHDGNATPSLQGFIFSSASAGGAAGTAPPFENLASITRAGTVFNEDSHDRDFRVESDSNANMLFVDSGNNRIGMGTNSGTGSLHIKDVRNSGGADVSVVAQNTTSNRIADFRILDESNNTTTKMQYDNGGNRGSLNFVVPNEGNADIGFDGTTFLLASNSSSATLELQSSSTARADFYASSGVVFNEPGNNYDFRVESDNNANAFVVDAGSDYVSVGQHSVTNPGNGNNNSGWSATTAGRMWASTGADHGFNRTSDGVVLSLRSGGVERGKISISGSTTTYATTSDARAKENIVDAPSASDDIDAIQVRSFDWKADGLHQKYGMVAQELLSIAPDAVAQGDSEEDMMGVDYSRLVPMLIKEIQSLRARVAQLESN